MYIGNKVLPEGSRTEYFSAISSLLLFTSLYTVLNSPVLGSIDAFVFLITLIPISLSVDTTVSFSLFNLSVFKPVSFAKLGTISDIVTLCLERIPLLPTNKGFL